MEKNPSNSEPEINDHDDSSGVGRSYECTFCKRGFTNAQALGGHMNIHRKDKAKSKVKNDKDESSKNNLRYFTFHEQQSEYHRGHVNYQVYLPSPNPNVWKQEHDDFDQGRVDSNLSLKIGISAQDVVKDNEVDLELRLGHHP